MGALTEKWGIKKERERMKTLLFFEVERCFLILHLCSSQFLAFVQKIMII